MKISHIRPLIIFSGLFLMFYVFTSCEKTGVTKSESDISKKIILNPFGEIVVNDIFEIELRNDTAFTVEVTGKESIVEKLSFDIDNDTLYLTDDNSLKWLPDYQPVKVIVSFPDISGIILRSPSEIYSEDTLRITSLSLISAGGFFEGDLTVDAFSISLVTSTDDFGHFTLRGKAENSDLKFFGSVTVDAGELKAKNAIIRNYSIGHCNVFAEETLAVWLGHTGNIYYQGSPEQITIQSMNSSGRLIPIAGSN